MGTFQGAQGQPTSQSVVGSDRNCELIRDFTVVLVSYKIEEEPNKNEGSKVVTTFSPIITLCELSVAIDLIWSKT